MKIAVLILRSLLGIIYLVFGLNFFFHFSFIPAQPQPTGVAATFMTGLFSTGYFFPYMKVLEVLGGLLLLVNRFTAVALLWLFPITLNIFLYHVILAPAGAPMGIVLILIHLFLGYAYFKYYASIFTAKPIL